MKEMMAPDHAFTRRLAPVVLDNAKFGKHLKRNTREFLLHFTPNASRVLSGGSMRPPGVKKMALSEGLSASMKPSLRITARAVFS